MSRRRTPRDRLHPNQAPPDASRRHAPPGLESERLVPAGSSAPGEIGIDELVAEYQTHWTNATAADLDVSATPRAIEDHIWSALRATFTKYVRERATDSVPVLFAHLEDRFRLSGRLQTLQVLLTFYGDGLVETHYLRDFTRDSEVLLKARESGVVVGGSDSPSSPYLTVREPSFSFTHRIEPDPGSRAAEVVRVLAWLTQPRARRSGAAKEALPPGIYPEPRLVRDAYEAEELAAEWVRAMGFADAVTTAKGADGGIDIHCPETGKIACQVKFEAVKTGRQTLQQLYGAGHARGASTFMFFSSAGYTKAALDWADGVGMALYRFAINGSMSSLNGPAQDLLDGNPR